MKFFETITIHLKHCWLHHSFVESIFFCFCSTIILHYKIYNSFCLFVRAGGFISHEISCELYLYRDCVTRRHNNTKKFVLKFLLFYAFNLNLNRNKHKVKHTKKIWEWINTLMARRLNEGRFMPNSIAVHKWHWSHHNYRSIWQIDVIAFANIANWRGCQHTSIDKKCAHILSHTHFNAWTNMTRNCAKQHHSELWPNANETVYDIITHLDKTKYCSICRTTMVRFFIGVLRMEFYKRIAIIYHAGRRTTHFKLKLSTKPYFWIESALDFYCCFKNNFGYFNDNNFIEISCISINIILFNVKFC